MYLYNDYKCLEGHAHFQLFVRSKTIGLKFETERLAQAIPCAS